MTINHPPIIIASRTEAGECIYSPHAQPPVKAVISIGDLCDKPCAGYGIFPQSKKLRLFFTDINQYMNRFDDPGIIIPKDKHIKQIVDFAENNKNLDGSLLIHCFAGKSRSPATALIVLLVWNGIDKIQECIDYVKEIRPHADPNETILDLAKNYFGIKENLYRRFWNFKEE